MKSLTIFFNRLNPDETGLLRQISGDLYVTEPMKQYVLPLPESEVEESRTKLRIAWVSGQSAETLQLLRRNLRFDRRTVAFLWAGVYRKFGYPLAAFEFALDLFDADESDEDSALLGIEASSELPPNDASLQFAVRTLKRRDRILRVVSSALFYLLIRADLFKDNGKAEFLAFAAGRLQLSIQDARTNASKDELTFSMLVLGAIYSTMGESGLAVETYRRTLDEDPTSLEALRLLMDEGASAASHDSVATSKSLENNASQLIEEASQRLLATLV